MIKTGHFLDLVFKRQTANGWYLTDSEGKDEVLLPNKYVPQNAEINQIITVFVYRDSEDRLIATTLIPKIELYRFAYLEVVAHSNIGAFLDWGLEKDLFIPFREQFKKLKKGDKAVVFLYRDEKTDRLLASAKISKWLNIEEVKLRPNTKVDLLVYDEITLGYKVIIDHKYRGIIYQNELFKTVQVGDALEGYVRKVRETGLVDVSPYPLGRSKVTGNVEVLWETLKKNKGYLALNDKTEAEEIQRALKMSKKAFKEAVGKLYKERKIQIDTEGIWIVNELGD